MTPSRGSTYRHKPNNNEGHKIYLAAISYVVFAEAGNKNNLQNLGRILFMMLLDDVHLSAEHYFLRFKAAQNNYLFPLPDPVKIVKFITYPFFDDIYNCFCLAN